MQQSRTAQCLTFLAMDRIEWLSCTGEGSYRGCTFRTISKEFQNFPLRLAKRGGYTGLMEGSGRGESMDWA